MDIDEIKSQVLKDGKFLTAYGKISFIQKKSFWNDIKDSYGDSPSEKLYCLFNNITSAPLCKCGKPLKFKSFDLGYLHYCSNSCKSKDIKRTPKSIEKMKESYKKTCLEKYGVENVYQRKDVVDKIQKARAEKMPEIVKKMAETNMKKYGVKAPLQNKDILAKMEQTNMERYGNICSMQGSNKEEYYQRAVQKYGKGELQSKASKVAGHNRYLRMFNRYNEYLKNENLALLTPFNKEKMQCQNVKLKCNICGREFIHHVNSIYMPICRTCHPLVTNKVSNEETEVYEYIKTLTSNTVYQSNRTEISPLELDIWCPIDKIAIEYDGLYWHNGEAFKDKHNFKTSECEKKGIRLIHIFDIDWREKKDIVKSILSDAFNKSIFIDYSSCTIREIDEDEYSLFFSENSLKKYVSPTIILGIYSNDSLIGCCTLLLKDDKCYISSTEKCGHKIINLYKIVDFIKKSYGIDNFIEVRDRMYECKSSFMLSKKSTIEPHKVYYDESFFNIDTSVNYIYNCGYDIYE
jgi:hypothetical protein